MTAESAPTPLEACPFCGAEDGHGEAALRCPNTDMVLSLQGRLLAGKFRLLSELGRGGMGAVWRARNIHVDREVALKLILPEVLKNPEIVARFRDEARVAARIGHAGICDILDFELTPLGPVIVMELLRGENLGERIEREGPLPPTVAVQLIRQALAALEAAHRAGIIHRDLKPENLFLHNADSGAVVVKLMDFGISKFTDRAGPLTGSGVIMGTPEYMAPEQVTGAANADVRTDLWAIGAVLYKAVTGVDPFVGENVVTILLAITSEAPAPIESHVNTVSPALSAVIMRCLSRKPDERFQTAAELADALQPFEPGSERSAAHVALGALPTLHADTLSRSIVQMTIRDREDESRPSRWPRRLLALSLLGALGFGAWWYVTQGPGARDPDIPNLIATATRVADGPDSAPPNLNQPAQPPAGERERTTRTVDPATAPSAGRSLASVIGSGLLGDVGRELTAQDWGAELSRMANAFSTLPAGEPAAPDPAQPGEPTPTTADPTSAPTSADPTTADPTSATTGEPSGAATDAGAENSGGEPAGTPAAEPAQARLIVSGKNVTPSAPGKSGDQRWAKIYCATLARNSFLGINRWKLANPTEARSFAKVEGIKPSGYWTTANHKGVGLVVWLPRGSDSSHRASKKVARPLCVAAKP